MLPIDSSQFDLSAAKDMSPNCEGPKIWQCGPDSHRYAITTPWKEAPVFAFESEEFTGLLDSLASPIVYFRLTRTECMLSDDPFSQIEIHLETADGECFRIDSQGSIK